MTKKRWPPDPLRVVIAIAIALIIGAVVVVGLADPVVDTEEAELAAAAAAAAAEARAAATPEPPVSIEPPLPEPEPVVKAKAPRTKKGKLLQQKLEERRAKLAAAAEQAGRPRVSLRAGGSEAAMVERVLKRKLDAAFVDEANASYALTLRVDRKPGSGVQLKCSVAVAALPGKNLLASFSSSVGVEGGDDAELLGDAATACAAALAEDLGPWLRKSK